ncbi:MAG: hypothetical protein IK089_01360, partial [Oxalobacter sp.]|nr:hypothetical protein [Oxalobacter sp.]
NVYVDGDLDAKDKDKNGVKLAGNQTGGVKANEAGNTLTYYAKKKTGKTLTLGTITTAFAAGGNAVASYNNEYDLTNAAITAGEDFKFTSGLDTAKTGDSMVVVDATKAIKNTSGETLKAFGDKEVKDTFDVDVKEKLNLKGTRTDKLTQNAAKTQLIYTVGDRNVTTATFSGPIAWNASEAYYTNDGYKFSAGSTIDASGLSFNQTTQLLKANDSMTLLSGAEGVKNESITQPSAGVAVEYTDSKNIKFNATASGTVSVASNDVKYTVGSVTTNKVTLNSMAWGTTASLPDSSWTASEKTEIDATKFAYTGTATTALTKGDTATILNATGLTDASPVTKGTNKTVNINHTDTNSINYVATASGHVVAAANKANYVVDSVAVSTVDLSNWNTTGTSTVDSKWTSEGLTVNTGNFTTSLTPGSSKDIVTAADGFFTGATYTGDNKYVNGDLDAEDKNKNGVQLAGTQTGGVKANDAGNTLTYYAKTKTGTALKLDTITSTFAKGGTVAAYGSEFDLTGADINADNFIFTNGVDKAATGATMTVVDATQAVKDGSGHALKKFDTKTYNTSFKDANVDGTVLTLEGSRNNTLSQDSAQTKLTYKVGAKEVEKASFDGSVKWSKGGTYYTNDSYQFKEGEEGASTDVSKLAFEEVTEEINKNDSMTLIKAADEAHAVKGTVSGDVTDIKVTLDKQTAKLEATAAGSAATNGNNLQYTVDGVTLNKVTVKSVGDVSVPNSWEGNPEGF